MEFSDSVGAVLITRDTGWPRDAALPLFGFKEIRVRNSCPNVLERYRIAAEMDVDHIFVQDDDCQLDDRIGELWQAYDGESLTCFMPPGNTTPAYQGTGISLVGFGAFFPRAWACEFMFSLPFWERVFGKSTVEIECDRLFTWTYRNKTKRLSRNVTQFKRFGRLSSRPEHYQILDVIARRLKEETCSSR